MLVPCKFNYMHSFIGSFSWDKRHSSFLLNHNYLSLKSVIDEILDEIILYCIRFDLLFWLR